MTSWTKQSPEIFEKPEHFVAFLKRFVEYLKVPSYFEWQYSCLQPSRPDARPSCCGWNSLIILQHLKDITYIERRPLRYASDVFIVHFNTNSDVTRFCAERLQSLIRTLQLNRLDEYASLQKVASFATLVATYEKGTVYKTIPKLSNSEVLSRLSAHSRALRNWQRHSSKSSLSFHVSFFFSVSHLLLSYNLQVLRPFSCYQARFERSAVSSSHQGQYPR